MRMIGVVLAGGESRRFGSPKAFAKYGGMAFYRIVLNQLQTIVNETAIVTKKDLIEDFYTSPSDHVRLLLDHESVVGKGPLAGIYSAMEEIKGDYYVTVACDMPFVKEEVLMKLLEEMKKHPKAMAVVPIHQGRIQPLCAIYHASCSNVIKDNLRLGKKRMTDLLDEIKVHYISFDAEQHYFVNINTNEEYEIV
ncbi:MAG: molybdenum cofactor guanylyltransferase, partial [Anaerobacillus sp.]